MADLDLEGLRTHRSAVPEVSEDALSSFDGISPSNELTYLDFHDAVRSAWGNGAPIKLESSLMPPNDGVRKHDDEKLLPVGPNLAGGDPEQFVEAGQLRPWMPTLKDCELLSQGEIF